MPNPQSPGSMSPEREAELIRKVEEGERYRSFLIDIGRHLDLLGTNISDLPAAVAAERKARGEAVSELGKLEEEIGEWQSSTMLDGRGGDPSNMAPIDNERNVLSLMSERDAARREAGELRKELSATVEEVHRSLHEAERLREAVDKVEKEEAGRHYGLRVIARIRAYALAPEEQSASAAQNGPPATERSGEGRHESTTCVHGFAVCLDCFEAEPCGECGRRADAPSPTEQSPQAAPSPEAGEFCEECYQSQGPVTKPCPHKPAASEEK